MNKLSLSIILGAFLVLIVLVIPSFAKEGLGLGKVGTTSAQENNLQPKNSTAQNNVMENLKSRADQEITRRVTSLTELITKINGLKKLSQANKTDLVDKVQAEITALNALKVKIDADADLTTLRTDVKSIVQSYRVYAFFIPQIRILSAADMMSQTTDNLTTLATKLESLISKSGATGANLTSLQTYLADMKAKLKVASDAYQAVETEVLALTPAGYPTNKTTLEDARAKLKAGSIALKAARDDAKQIIKILRSLNKELKATKSAELEK